MKRSHETEISDGKVNLEEHRIYSPIEDLQKIEGVSPLKRNSLDLDNKPKGIRFIGYFIIGFIVVSTLFVLIANLFYN
ncbi:hypothetical protein [Gottfriedia acidiceleris]|uniref:hypothetical protein n=1 Tax=Gottfriedia acidiceleris TaxID=371036 RepID=UPI003D21697B